jgi:hypothetical protein
VGEVLRQNAGGVGATGRVWGFRPRLRVAPVLLQEASGEGTTKPMLGRSGKKDRLDREPVCVRPQNLNPNAFVVNSTSGTIFLHAAVSFLNKCQRRAAHPQSSECLLPEHPFVFARL